VLQGQKLKILFASAEVVPFAKTGGLADVAGALPQALAALGHDVRVVLPRYGCIDTDACITRPAGKPFSVPLGNTQVQMFVEECDALPGVTSYLLNCEELYGNRSGLYGYGDDDRRFVAYSRGILEMLPGLGWTPDVIHCNDWHTGLVPVFLKTLYAHRTPFKRIATLLSIHNLAYQGTFSPGVMELAGLPWELFTWQKLAHYDAFNFLKAGLLYADALNAVSPTYAKEILTPAVGAGLDGVLRFRHEDLFGILNGIDYSIWNPTTDPHLPANFTAEAPAGKAACKRALQEEVELPVRADVPLIGIVGRLTSQKGLDLLEIAGPEILTKHDVQVVLLGNGDPYYEHGVLRMMRRFPDKFAARLGFHDGLAHRIYAGSDIFGMPSHYEPCGLGQIISLSYGTVPLVRATGGLVDTVTPFDNTPTGTGNGYIFHEYSPIALVRAIDKALRCYTAEPTAWTHLVQNAFASRFTWSASAEAYVHVYQYALGNARGTGSA
jgi:starch synthase